MSNSRLLILVGVWLSVLAVSPLALPDLEPRLKQPDNMLVCSAPYKIMEQWIGNGKDYKCHTV